jgi:hypothetical protein
MAKLKHGKYKSSTYRSWINLRSRCKTDKDYITKGITVCDRWNTFENFYADMGDRPDGLTIDRIDGAKGYSPDNCRWATYKQQNRNLSSNVYIDGELLADVVNRTGLGRTTIQYRHANNLPIEQAPIKERDRCKAGHEWTDENTYYVKVKTKQGGYRMGRYCRTCRAKHQADLRARRSK